MLAGMGRVLPPIAEVRCAARTLAFCSRRMVEDPFGDGILFVNKELQVQSEECVRTVTIALWA